MRRRPRRFSREWQRERAQAQADESDQLAYRLSRLFGRSPFWAALRRRDLAEDKILSYRGFRAGRSRLRPDETGYGEPVRPTPQGDWHDHPWLTDLHDEPPTAGPVIGETERWPD